MPHNLSYNVTNITLSYQIQLTDDEIVVGQTLASITITLPSVSDSSEGDSYLVKDGYGSASVYSITISGNGTTIDGYNSITLVDDYDALEVTYNEELDGWFIKSQLSRGTSSFDSVNVSGDVIGNTRSTTVVGLQNRTISPNAPTNNQVLTWINSNNDWEPATPTLGGDVTGPYASNTVAKIQGVIISGTPSAGYVLEATGSTAASWTAPSVDITLTGDVTGIATANILSAIDGYTLPNPGNNTGVLQSSGTALSWSTTPTLGNITVSGLTDTGHLFYSVQNNLTAIAGGQGSAAAITADIVVVSTCPSGGGIILSPTTIGTTINITNNGANNLNVYPNVGGAIDTLATNTAATITPEASVEYTYVASNTWVSIVNGVYAGVGVTANHTAGGLYQVSIGQSVATSASPTFAGITLSGLGTGIVHSGSGGAFTSSLIVNADIAASGTANIAVNKLAAGTSAQVLLNNATPIPTWTSISGDVTISATGATTVAAIDGYTLPNPGNHTGVLQSNGTTLSFGTVSLTTQVAGLLPVATNLSIGTANQILVTNAGATAAGWATTLPGNYTFSGTPTFSNTLALNTTGTSGGLTGTPSITINALTATTINGSAFSGTFTGAPTFSGNIAFTGTPTFSNTLALNTSGTSAGLTGSPSITVSGITDSGLGTGIVHSGSGGAFTSSLLVNADIGANSLSVAKLTAGTSAQVLMSSGTPTSTWTSISGDISITNTGATTLAAIDGYTVASPAGGTNGQVLGIAAGNNLTWQTVSGGGSVTWASDLSGNSTSTSSNQYVSSLSYSSAAGGGAIQINGTGTSLNWAVGNTGPSIIQTAPASVSSGTGTAGSNMAITAQAGGADTGTSVTAGAGGKLTLNAGVGGSASGGTNSSGGAGANIVINAGAGGAKSGSGTVGNPGLIDLQVAANSRVQISDNSTATTVSLSATGQTYTLSQASLNTNSGVGAALTIQAQNETGTTSTGGALNLTSGTGTTAAGAVVIQTGGTTRLTANASGVVTVANLGTGIVHADSSGNLTSSLIVNADIAASGTANIAVNKLAAGTSAQVLLNNATPTPTWTTLSGDVTVSSTGVTTLGEIDGYTLPNPGNNIGVLQSSGTALSWTQSPAFTSPTATTQSADDNSTKVATTAYADRNFYLPTVVGFRDDFFGANTVSPLTSAVQIMGGDTIWQIGYVGGGTASSVEPGNSTWTNPGQIQVTTSATNGQGGYIAKSGFLNAFGSNSGWDLHIIAGITSSTANICIRFGLLKVLTADPPTDGIYVEYDTANSNTNTDFTWVTRSGATSNYSTTNAIAADTDFHHFRIRSNVAGTILFSVDGGTEASISSDVTTANLFPSLQILTRASAQKTMNVDFVSFVSTTSRI